MKDLNEKSTDYPLLSDAEDLMSTSTELFGMAPYIVDSVRCRSELKDIIGEMQEGAVVF